MGFGTELLLMLLLGILLLGPKQMHALLRHVGRAKAQLDQVTRSVKSQLTAELEAPSEAPKHDPPPNADAPPNFPRTSHANEPYPATYEIPY